MIILPYDPKDRLDPDHTFYCVNGKCPWIDIINDHPITFDYTSGNDHPDDTFSVADAIFPGAPVDLADAYYRLAVKHNKAIVLNYFVFKKLVQERDAYLEGLTDGAVADQAYLDAVGAQINSLYESFGVDQKLL